MVSHWSSFESNQVRISLGSPDRTTSVSEGSSTDVRISSARFSSSLTSSALEEKCR